MSKFYVGDKVKVVTKGDHNFNKGAEYIIENIQVLCGSVIYTRSKEHGDFCYDNELELVESNFARATNAVVREAISKFNYTSWEEEKEAPKKYNKNKPMMSLIRPEFTKGLAEALTYGYTKYDEKRGDIQNYLKGEGFYYSEIIDSLERHINAFKSGTNIDEESGLHHLSLR